MLSDAQSQSSTSTRADQPAASEVAAVGPKPTFIGIGAQRCASSWIQRCLEDHPEVFTSEPAELHYFSNRYERGEAWYLSHFAPGPAHRAWGEKSPSYLTIPETPGRVRAFAPDVRLFCCLRNPIERAYSDYQMKKKGGKATGSFEDALQADPGILKRGEYAPQLRRWLDHFPREQLLILLYDDLQTDEPAFIRRIYEHVGVEPEFKPSWLGQTYNAILFPDAQRRLHSLGLGAVVRAVKRSRLGPAIRKWHNRRKRAAAQPVAPDALLRLQDHYAAFNDELATLLGRDLSHWSAPTWGGVSRR